MQIMTVLSIKLKSSSGTTGGRIEKAKTLLGQKAEKEQDQSIKKAKGILQDQKVEKEQDQNIIKEKGILQGQKVARAKVLIIKKVEHDVEEEKAEREIITARFLDAVRPQLPGLMQDLGKIKDFRNPKKIEHGRNS